MLCAAFKIDCVCISDVKTCSLFILILDATYPDNWKSVFLINQVKLTA